MHTFAPLSRHTRGRNTISRSSLSFKAPSKIETTGEVTSWYTVCRGAGVVQCVVGRLQGAGVVYRAQVLFKKRKKGESYVHVHYGIIPFNGSG